MKSMRKFYLQTIISIYFLIKTTLATAQQNVHGTVRSTDDSTPLPFVTVVVKGTQVGVNTDAGGKFTIAASTTQTLIFSFVGYKTKEIEVGSQSEINVMLSTDAASLDEAVVVGYGTQSRSTLTTSITKLDPKVLENTTFANAASALQGTVSGVRIQTTSGQPGASPRVIVRGGASINNPNGAAPLYVIDGILRSDMDGINALDIESMQVLKDAAATAIYGARASNGVVIVALKKGVAGKTRINYSYSLGFTKLREKYNVLSSRDYIYYGRLGVAAIGEKHPERLPWLSGANGQGIGNDLTNNTAYTTQYLSDVNKHKLDEGWQSMPDPLDPAKTIIFDDTDWQKVLFRTGVTQEHYLSFSGGNEKATFNMGAGYTKIDGIAIKTNYNRFTANMNGKLQVNSKMFVYAGLNLSRFGNNTVYSESEMFERSIGLPPTAKYKYEDGSLAPGQNKSQGNPEYYMGRTKNNNQVNIITVSGGLNWEILPNLIFEPVASLLYRVTDSNAFQMSYFNTPVQFVDSRDASSAYAKLDQKQMDATLSYTKSFNNAHNFQIKSGLSYFDRQNRSLDAAGRGAATDLISTLNASATPVSVSSSATSQAILGFFGRLTYDYNRKYLFSLSARYDGASNLGDKNKWGFFPGMSAGWNIHNENFWIQDSPLSNLKLRTSYGVNGNLGNLSDFQAQGQYTVGARYDGLAGVEYSVMANPALRWEQSKTLDFGLDAGFLKDRIRLIADYYRRNTQNLITTLALPEETGFSSILTNLGSLENKGLEMEISAGLISTDNFSWTLSVNASKNKNKILKLPDNDNEHNRIGGFNVYDPVAGAYVWKGGLQEGSAIGNMYGYKQMGIYATDEQAAAGPRDELVAGTDKRKFGGDVNWLDVDKNKIIDTKDRVYMGNIYPKWTGGASNTLIFKGLSLYIRMDYTLGHTIYNYVRANMNAQFQGDVNGTTDLLRSWLKQGDKTDVPRYYWADQAAQSNYWRGDPRNLDNGAGNSVNYEKGDYMALREVTFSYTLPQKFLSKVGVSSLKVNFTGNNLKYFTKYTGLAPEEGGLDRGRYPVPRVLTAGIKASF
ncbi:SusC/RagA family TonB-linked outer membrane protein [Dyadobacter frigoris]|uniref:SusC/RagA family TonB-linked outer membrane protein n=1 Tax=Dyadobacter frigoris TaxID=2576211 RepID=UPI0024A5861E|nr:TonB-dependent receptor [Dyadobacter frigoris]GLU52836.1 SusC/RagA family TonB-linked outer membrane protein [Dyadobacter frigoris]